MPPKKLTWDEKLSALQRYKDKHGDTLVPQGYSDDLTGMRLGRFVANLRQRADFLSENQHRDLKKLGFIWRRFKVFPWDQKIEALKKYVIEYGDAMVPKDFIDSETGMRLGGWVDRLRQSRNKLPLHKKQELDELGMVWNAYEANWETMFELLQDYKAEFNHASPKVSLKFRNMPLGQWVGMQRQIYSRWKEGEGNPMDPERVALLEGIGFKWRLRKRRRTVSKESDDASTGEASDASLRAEEEASKRAKHHAADFEQLVHSGPVPSGTIPSLATNVDKSA